MSSPSSDDLVEDGPPVIDPYEVLGLEREATADQVKTAYRKAALRSHPDKVPADQKDEAHSKFQSVAFAYAVLSDPARRKRYDATGSTSDSLVDADGFNWSDYYREQYRDAVSTEAIAKFANQYKGSDEEKDDVLIAYEASQGDMDGIYESVMLSDVVADDERFRRIIDEAIDAGDVPALKAYTNESKRKRQSRMEAAKAEAGEAEDYARELGVHEKLFGDKAGTTASTKKAKGKGRGKGDAPDEDGLAALIQRNPQSRAGFLDGLAEKYGATTGKSKKSGKRTLDQGEPSEEAFQAAAARLKKPKAGGSRK